MQYKATYINLNKLSNVLSYIIKNKGLKNAEIDQIRTQIYHERPRETSSQVDEIQNLL